tara:strand:- start:5861 stop:6514 length:654 start_codon:yes stop_codon:yes gene_type:complete
MMKIIIAAFILFLTLIPNNGCCDTKVDQENAEIRRLVQFKMIQANKLHQQGNSIKAKQLVNESIEIMLTSIQNGKYQYWMEDGLKIAMRANRASEEEIQKVMGQIDLYAKTKEKTVRPLSLREKLNSLTDTPAVRELAVSRRRASLDGMFLGQRNGPVGYHPIISILPQGDSMTTGVVVSPDRRYVRVGVSMMNVGVGAVHTFNFSTGEAESLEGRK